MTSKQATEQFPLIRQSLADLVESTREQFEADHNADSANVKDLANLMFDLARIAERQALELADLRAKLAILQAERQAITIG